MYPLQTLFDLREKAKKDAEETYAKLKKILDEEELKLKNLQEELLKMKTFRFEKRHDFYSLRKEGELELVQLKSAENYLKMLLEKEIEFQKKIEKQQEVVRLAKQNTHEALQVMMKATEEFKVLEKHQEKWLKKRKKILEKKEEDEADEITQARFAKNASGGFR